MAYNELIKNFERVRSYMRSFYVYGFKSREDYDAKSARSYDDERRRIESWLGPYMGFTRTADGKSVFISVDSRKIAHNPFYQAWKAKSFTDKDITLHFILFDILHSPEVKLTLNELVDRVDEYVMDFHEPMRFDESTIRKKLKEYEGEGIICAEKQGRRVLYSRTEDIDLRPLLDVIDFFGEAAPCGVVGSFLRDKEGLRDRAFRFKHHYLTQATDSDVLACLFDAMQQKRYITADYLGKRSGQVFKLHLVPLRIYISAQNGRQNLLAYEEKSGRVGAYRPEYLSAVKAAEPCERFDELRDYLGRLEKNMWGVNCKRSIDRMEHVEFEVFVGGDEQYIVQRLEREKRCGRVEQVDEHHYRYVADVFDTLEMVPWIRTFLCRITKLNLSDRTLENRLKQEIEEMYRMYGIDGGDGDAV